jgi:hypothetical protein
MLVRAELTFILGAPLNLGTAKHVKFVRRQDLTAAGVGRFQSDPSA